MVLEMIVKDRHQSTTTEFYVSITAWERNEDHKSFNYVVDSKYVHALC